MQFDRARHSTATLPHMRKWLVGFLVIPAFCVLLGAADSEKVDLGVLHRIKSEAFARNSRVMDTLFYLTDVYGPRLTARHRRSRFRAGHPRSHR
jgi:hypothetical protein